MNIPAVNFNVVDIVEDYESKLASLDALHAEMQALGVRLNDSTQVMGAYGDGRCEYTIPSVADMKGKLLRSAWQAAYSMCRIGELAPLADRERIERGLSNPPPLTVDNIRANFGAYLQDARFYLLKGLADQFTQLDQSFKSHERVKVGAKGLPKRVIMRHMADSYFGGLCDYGIRRLLELLKPFAVLQGIPWPVADDCRHLAKGGEWHGLKGKLFANGNMHLTFSPEALNVVNGALAEFYGDVLPDAATPRETKRKASTALSKDLQFYPTPAAVAQTAVGMARIHGAKVLEPSCGKGAILKEIYRAKGQAHGVEVDPERAAHCRAMGFSVTTANFLELTPSEEFDAVIMNPPFYGRHYALHVLHAVKFLKPRGQLVAILPATAVEHGELDHLKGRFTDLPVASFRESGTNVATTIFTWSKP